MKSGPFETNQVGIASGNKWVTMTNALARAAHGLSLQEKKLMALAIAKLDSRRKADWLEEPCVKIGTQEYAEAFGLDPSTAYTVLQQAGRDLMKRQIALPLLNNTNKKKRNVEYIQWVGRETHYADGLGWIEIVFYRGAVPHLMGLTKHFTSYRVEQCRELRSVNSWKLLELLMSYKDTGWMDISIGEFCEVMALPQSTRANFAHIRRKVIEPAIAELKAKDGWLIDWRKNNHGGRRVEGLRFTFQRNPQAGLFPTQSLQA
jgi:plasmid replication initiation protein